MVILDDEAVPNRIEGLVASRANVRLRLDILILTVCCKANRLLDRVCGEERRNQTYLPLMVHVDLNLYLSRFQNCRIIEPPSTKHPQWHKTTTSH